jgi:uncharacterized protein YjbI with pentapeptide repeats
VAIVLGWALFVPAADLLARHDVNGVTGINLETARNNARGNLLALTAGLAGFGALLVAARNFTLQRRSLQLAQESQRRTHELTEQGQVTDRYTKAIEQLGSDKVGICIGGVYALERIAGDSVRDHPTVMEVLSAFIREHVHEGSSPNVTADIQAALSVLGRRHPDFDRRDINLKNAHLIGAVLNGAHLTHADLTRADLTGAELIGAEPIGADLTGADLTRADLIDADLSHADLRSANLTEANLRRADLSNGRSPANLTGGRAHADSPGAHLGEANLTRADLRSANLTRATLINANLTEANLGSVLGGLDGADLTGADLTRADLHEVRWPARIPSPAGWRLNDAGRLERAGPDEH